MKYFASFALGLSVPSVAGPVVAHPVNQGVEPRAAIGLVIFGQSTETAVADLKDLTTFPRAFQSQRNDTVTSLLPGLNYIPRRTLDGKRYGNGSMWPVFYDDMWDWGYDVHMMNAAIGSQSFFLDANGYPREWAAKQTYFRSRRTSVGPDDPGTSGTISIQNGLVWESTIGSEVYTALDNRGKSIVNAAGDTLPNRLNYIYRPTLATKSTGALIPTFAAAIGTGVASGTTLKISSPLYGAFHSGQIVAGCGGAHITAAKAGNSSVEVFTLSAACTKSEGRIYAATVENTVSDPSTNGGTKITDGAVIWTCIGDASAMGYRQNHAFSPSSVGAPGFDPLGLVRRAGAMVKTLKAQGITRVIVLLENGQSDAGTSISANSPATSAANYQAALMNLTNYFRGLGAEVAIGFSTYARGRAAKAADASNYTMLSAARTATLARFAADTLVHPSADLTTELGTVEGANGLTFNCGPYPGVTGCTSAYDGVHPDASAMIVEGHTIASSWKAWLPRLKN